MTIGITGATGFIGRKIIDLALRRGHEIVAFTRTPERGIPGCEMRAFSLDRPPEITGCDALINLAGEPVAGLWTAAKKRRIIESRVLATRRLAEAIHIAVEKPEVLVSGSAIGFYGDRGDTELTETAACGDGFLADTVTAWEAEARNGASVRIAFLRIAVVLGSGGGALAAMAPLFKLGLGAKLGDGQQWVSWIHLEDVAMLALFAVENLDVRGPINAAAPWPVRNADFTKSIASAVHRPAIFRIPAFALRAMLGGLAGELLDSKRVLPAVAAELGFRFQFPELAAALANIFA